MFKLNQRTTLNEVCKILKINCASDFYQLKIFPKKIRKKLNLKRSAAFQPFLVEIYPEFEDFLFAWKFVKVPTNYWNSIGNQIFFLKSLEKEKKLTNMEDWYKIRSKNFGSLYKKYNSKVEMLKVAFPDYDWLPWKFSKLPTGYWDSLENQKIFFKHFSKEMNLKTTKDWYKLSTKDFKKFRSIYVKYPSIIEMLKTIFPNHLWFPWKLTNLPKNWTKKKLNRRIYFEHTSNILNVKYPKDLFAITVQDICDNDGSALILKYNSNLSFCFSDLYPEIQLLPWNFSNIPLNFWESSKNVLDFLNWCKIKFKINSIQDWKTISYQEIAKIGGNTLLRKYGGISNIVDVYLLNDKENLTPNDKKNFKLKKKQYLVHPKTQKVDHKYYI